MTRRERMEARVEKRRDWSEKAAVRSDARLKTAHTIADGIPLGQPILVGHHSERRHRKDAERIRTNMSKGIEEQKLSQHHDRIADTLEDRLETTVFSDDTDAISALEARVAEREKKADRDTSINKAWRKGGAAAVLALGLSEALVETLSRTMALCPWLKGPCDTTNTRASIRRDKDRIEQIKRQQARIADAEAAGGTLFKVSGEYTVITFAEKPSREILDALHTAKFWWGSGSWTGRTADLPEVLRP